MGWCARAYWRREGTVGAGRKLHASEPIAAQPDRRPAANRCVAISSIAVSHFHRTVVTPDHTECRASSIAPRRQGACGRGQGDRRNGVDHYTEGNCYDRKDDHDVLWFSSRLLAKPSDSSVDLRRIGRGAKEAIPCAHCRSIITPGKAPAPIPPDAPPPGFFFGVMPLRLSPFGDS